MLRNMDGGAVLPGVDTNIGNPLSLNSLTPYTSISTNWAAKIQYEPQFNSVVITQPGAVISGVNFGNARVYVDANNVTIENCTFSNPWTYASIQQANTASGTVIENDSFIGTPAAAATLSGVFISAENSITITGNQFIDAGSSAIHVESGATVTGNYIQGGAFDPALHADGVVVLGALQPTVISDNFIDWTVSPGESGGTLGQPVRVEADTSSCNNVMVSGNYLIGGAYSSDVGNQAFGTYTFSNVAENNNFMGFSLYGPYAVYGAHAATFSGNTVFDFNNPIYSTKAWNRYQASGLKTSTLVTSTGGYISAANSGSTTLYGAGYSGIFLSGSNAETLFVGGAGTQYLDAGHGANIYTYLSFGDSTANACDVVNSFDSAKDVIDLSGIDADPVAPGTQNFTFIGTAALTSAGAQVDYYQDPTNNCTWVDATMAGGSSANLVVKLRGLQTLTASNFALTSAQSQAAVSAGAALKLSISGTSGAPTDYSYSNVQGRSYNAFDEVYSGNTLEATDLHLTSGANQMSLAGSDPLSVIRGSGTESLQTPTGNAHLSYALNESIQANAGPDLFAFSSGFGQETINGLALTGAAADTIQLSKSTFSYLNSAMTQGQMLAAVLAQATTGPSGTTLHDSAGDSLTLAGVSAASIAASPSQFRFV